VEAGAGGSGCGEAQQEEPRTQLPSGVTCPECLETIAERAKDAAADDIPAVLERSVLATVRVGGQEPVLTGDVVGLGRTRTGLWQVAVLFASLGVEEPLIFPADQVTRA